MTDERLRDLERRYQTSGAKDDEQAYDTERVRAGEAIETGFLERVRDGGKYGSRVRVHLRGSSQLVSLEPLISDMQLVDVELVNGRIHLLSRSRAANMQWWLSLHVLAEDGRTEYVKYPRRHCRDPAYQAMIDVGGELGLVSRDESGTSVYFDGVDGFQVENGDVFDYSDEENCLYCDSRTRQIVSSEENGVLGRWQEEQWREAGGVYVMGGRGIFCTASGAAAEGDRISGVIPASSRFAQERFAAPAGEELERYHDRISGDLVRVIREVPKANLEGLLAKIQKTVDAKSASRGIYYD